MAAQRSGLAVGLNKGHVTTAREIKPKPVNRKGVTDSQKGRSV